MKEIILASSSPRRREILEKFGFKPTIIKPEIQEKVWSEDSPAQIVMGLSFEKAFSVSEEVEKGKIIIASDTIVVYKDELLGKPKDKKDAFKILTKLNGNKHSVITGIAIIESKSNKKIIDYEETIVEFKISSDEKIKKYIDTLEPMDKAGAYGIQEYGQLLVRKIEGSYLNVVGLPIEKIDDILKENFNINIL